MAIGCNSNEETNTTSTTTTSKPTSEFESLKLPHSTNTTLSIYHNSTEQTREIQNVTTEIPIAFKRKPFVKVRKLKKIHKTTQLDNSYRVKENNADLNRQESKFIVSNPYSIKSRYIQKTYPEIVHGKNSSIKYTVAHDYRREESRVTNNVVKPDVSYQQSTYNPYGLKKKLQYSRRVNRNNSNDFRHPEESRRNENYLDYSYKFETRPQEGPTSDESQNNLKKGGRPTLPEIQNVIHTLDSQDSTPSYKSPKQNHIVEVTEVPLVFEHHYEGDYKNPQSNFVAHQYSYSPPADPTNEALRLGKLLSQNVVQKLQTAQEPLREYVHDQQELILAGYTHGVPTYSFVNFNLNPEKFSFQNSQSNHPLMKYLAPEMTPQSFRQEIQHFQSPQTNPYQFVRPQTHMQPIVVEDQDIRSEYETTYLQAINRPQHQNQETQTHYEQSHDQTEEHQQKTEEHSVPKSPYSVNVQQQYVNAPKYTIANFKSNNKPQAIHEVEPPNLSGLTNSYNFNSIQYQIPAALPTPESQILHNHAYNVVQTEEEQQGVQEQQVENPNLNALIPSTKLIHFVIPSPSTPTLVHQTRPQMVSTRPYWRKPQVMKLVRVPEKVHQQQEEPSYQSHYQSYRPPVDSRIRNQQLYQSLAEHYSTPVRMQQILNQHDHKNEYSNHIMRLVPQKLSQQQQLRQQFSRKPIIVEDYSVNTNEEEEARGSPYAHANQVSDDSIKYQNLVEQNYQNERPSIHSNNQGNVEIVKSISQYYPQQQEQIQPQQHMYGKAEMQEDTSSDLPKGYLSYQPQKIHPRMPGTRHIMPLVRYRSVENYDADRRTLNPRIRRLVSDLLKDNSRRQNVYVVMTEED